MASEFNAQLAAESWSRLSSAYSHRKKKTFSAWDRLSYYMRHHYSREYDGGLLRVIAFFGECFPDGLLTNTEVYFQAGPMSAHVVSDSDSQDVSGRYLLLLLAKIFSEDEYLHRYIKGHTNAGHTEREEGRSPAMFGELKRLLDEEINEAYRRNDTAAYLKLYELDGMLRSLCRADF